jgi:hypothetical protein
MTAISSPFLVIWVVMIIFRRNPWMRKIAPAVFDWVDFVVGSIVLSGYVWLFFTLCLCRFGVSYSVYFSSWFALVAVAAFFRHRRKRCGPICLGVPSILPFLLIWVAVIAFRRDPWVRQIASAVFSWVDVVVGSVVLSGYVWLFFTFWFCPFSVSYRIDFFLWFVLAAVVAFACQRWRRK